MKTNICLWSVLLLTQALAVSAQVPAGFASKPTFDEEFTENALHTATWKQRGLGVRNHCVNTPDAIRVHDGYATITTYSTLESGVPTNYCGMITTDGTFSQKYGYWETAVRFHAVPGFQCAFWVQSSTIGSMIGHAENSGTEMDVFEHLAQAKEKQYDHAIHWDGYGPAHKHVVSHQELDTFDDGKFHVFGVAWTPSGYTFYVDGKVSYEVSPSEVPVSAIPEYIILSSEVPRAFPAEGFGSKQNSQATFDIDYVRVYPYKPHKESAK
ncbi:MAG: glycoside hydrolase family 16 protein [Acidobacteriaceae bacterium]|nr:glycoside hydrolase family 16 protein [Acidobacteriaceae bacterium]